MTIHTLLEEMRDTLSYLPAKDLNLVKNDYGYYGSFSIEGNTFLIRFYGEKGINPAKPKSTLEALLLDYKNSFIIEFSLSKGDKEFFGNTGTGNVAKVFSTVLHAIKEVIEKENSEAIMFKIPEEKNKQRLYKKFLLRAGEFISGYSGKRIIEKVYGIVKK